jgi:methionyl-tRNA formyltransferase
MRVFFAASPAIAVNTLEILSNTDGIELAGVLTNPDTPKGRQGIPQPTEVGLACRANFPVLKPLNLDAKAREDIAALKPELLVSFAYGRIFGPKFLELFPLGGINIHPSLLPKYRGPSPIQAAILNRDRETGISIQTIAAEIDCGDILAQEVLQLTGRETAASLSDIVSHRAASMLPGVLEQIAAGKARKMPQDNGKASYCKLIDRDAGLIDWNKSAAEIEAAVRAYNPWPLCRTSHKGRELYILKAAAVDAAEAYPPGFVFKSDQGIFVQTGEGALAPLELQYQAKKALEWRDFLNGARDFIGSKLG